MRKFIVIVVLFLGAAFVYLSFGELESILTTLQKGNLWYILLAAGLQASWFLVVGSTYQGLFHMLGVDGTVYRYSLVSAAANFVNIVAPSGGMGGMAVFIMDARRNGGSSGKATGWPFANSSKILRRLASAAPRRWCGATSSGWLHQAH